MPMDEMRKIRGNDMAMIFQEPLTSLNPVFTIGDQIAEQVQLHLKVDEEGGLGPGDRGARRWSASRSPERRVKQYPHEMSGGMRQRVMIAMAPVVRAEAAHRGRTHDRPRRDDPGPDPGAPQVDPGADRLGAAAHHPRPRRRRRDGRRRHRHVRRPGRGAGDGRAGPARAQGARTRWACSSRSRPPRSAARGSRSSRASCPSPFNLPPACRFEPRCPYAWEACREIVPPLVPSGAATARLARCHLETEVGATGAPTPTPPMTWPWIPSADAALTGGME